MATKQTQRRGGILLAFLATLTLVGCGAAGSVSPKDNSEARGESRIERSQIVRDPDNPYWTGNWAGAGSSDELLYIHGRQPR
jgi:hypothetical protein